MRGNSVFKEKIIWFTWRGFLLLHAIMTSDRSTTHCHHRCMHVAPPPPLPGITWLAPSPRSRSGNGTAAVGSTSSSSDWLIETRATAAEAIAMSGMTFLIIGAAASGEPLHSSSFCNWTKQCWLIPLFQGGHSLGGKNSRTFQRLSTNFSRPIPATFYPVTEYLMKAILESI